MASQISALRSKICSRLTPPTSKLRQSTIKSTYHTNNHREFISVIASSMAQFGVISTGLIYVQNISMHLVVDLCLVYLQVWL